MKVRTHFRKNAKGFDLNGAESINSPANYYSPYIISVGSFGLSGDNMIIPSYFSSIGFNNYNLLPHVFGPGELIIDNQVIQGTSFSTPFIGAISTFSQFMSPKSLMREISSHDRWADNVPGKDRGAWGIPDAKDLLFSRTPAFDDEIIVHGTTYRHSGADTEFFFNVNKNYADGMQFNFRLDLIDPVTQEVIIAKNTTQPFSLEKSVKADQGDFLEEAVYFNIPGEFVPDEFLGKEVLVKVYVSTDLRKDRWVELDNLYSIITLNY